MQKGVFDENGETVSEHLNTPEPSISNQDVPSEDRTGKNKRIDQLLTNQNNYHVFDDTFKNGESEIPPRDITGGLTTLEANTAIIKEVRVGLTLM